MGSFAVALQKQGISVTGSDQNIYPPMSDVLKNAGVQVFLGYDAANIQKANPDLVIVGNVIRKTNPEMEAIQANKIPYLSLPGALETMVLKHKHPVVIAGTHGKTTTTSMLAHILQQLGEEPSFFIGGVPHNFSESFRLNESRYMVLEGDEYDTAFFDKVPKFTHYCPQDAILTSVEFDHADIYSDFTAVVSAFEKLAEVTKEDGFFITCAETETPLRVALKTSAKVISYGYGSGVDSRATRVELLTTGARFEWENQKVLLNMSGRHNILNALACLTWVRERGLDTKNAIDALASFQGVKRRQEVFGSKGGITLIDDFAHHPTAVRETLDAIRARYPQNRIIACFEPRSATSRRRVFQKAYSESFDAADGVFISKPYDQATINPVEQFSTEELLTDLSRRGKTAKLVSTDESGVKIFKNELRSGDVVLVMSNGGFDGFLPKLLKAISK